MVRDKGLAKTNFLGMLQGCLRQSPLASLKQALQGRDPARPRRRWKLALQNRALRGTQWALEQARDHYAELYELAPAGYATLDDHGIIRELNVAGAALLRDDRRHLIGQPFIHSVAQEDNLRFLSHLRDCHQRGNAIIELRLLTRAGRDVLVRLSCRTTDTKEHGIHYLMVMTDLREALQTEELRRAYAALEQLRIELQAAKQAREETAQRQDEFLAMLAHELRNPLAPIRNAVRAISRLAPAESPTWRWLNEIIERKVIHLSHLVDDLLEVSRLTGGKVQLHRQPTDLTDIVTQAVETVQPLLEARRHRLTVSLPSPPVRLNADPDRLIQVIENLLTNAAHYTPDGGQIELRAEQQGSEVVLRVRDNGIGMAPELLARIFDLFVQGDQGLERRYGGLGIGLTLVKRWVELHGGRVAAFSAGPGRGSELVIWLPG